MHGRFKTVAYKKWLTDAGWELKAQRPPRVEGRYAMHLSFGAVRQRRDLSNCIKAVEDLIVAHGIVEDDSLAVRIVAEWASEPGVTVTIQQEPSS